MTEPSPDPPKPLPTRRNGLGPKEQRLQALREKLAHAQSGVKSHPGAPGASTGFQPRNSFTGKKAAFQRKAT